MDPLPFHKRDHGIAERSKALELSLRSHLSPSDLEEHHNFKALLAQHDNDRRTKAENARRAKAERYLALEKSYSPALHPWYSPRAKGYNGDDNAHRQPFESFKGVDQHLQQRLTPLAPHEDPELRRDWEPSHDQRGCFEFEIADQKRRLARMGLVDRNSQWEYTPPQTPDPSPTPKPTNHQLARTWVPKEKPAQTTFSPPIPKPTNHHCAPKETFVPQMWVPPKPQEQQSKTPACRGWIQQVPVLKSRARKEDEQRKLVGQKFPEQRPAEQNAARQKCEQEKIHLPAAKPGNLYPGPTRIPGVLPPNHILHEDGKKQNRMSERARSELHKIKLARLEEIRYYKEENERKDREQQQQAKATLSAPKPEATKREPVKQLLAGVNRALEPKVEVAQGGAADRVEIGAFQAYSQQPLKGPKDAYEASLKCGRSFWEKYDKSYPIPGQSTDRPTGIEFARHTGTSRGEVPHDSSRTSDLRAAVEAIDKTSGNLLGISKTASDHDKTPTLEPSGVIVSGDKGNDLVGIADLSLTTIKDHPANMVPRQDAPLPPIPCAEQMSIGTKPEEDNGGVKDATEDASLADVDMHSEWEEVEHSPQDDGWSGFEQDSVDNDWTGSSSSPDMDWASDVMSEGCV